GISNGNLALAIVFSAVLGALVPVFTETMRALRKFAVVSWTNALSPMVRFAAMALLLPVRGLTGYFAGQACVPVFVSATALWNFLRTNRAVRPVSWWRGDRALFLSYIMPLAATSVAGGLCSMAEVLPFAHMPKAESAAWYQLTRFSEIASYMGTAVVFVLFPVASSRHERGEDTLPLLARAMALVLALGTAFSLVLALSGTALFSSVGFLSPYAGFTHWLLPLGILASARTAVGCFAAHEMACARFAFLRYTVPISLCEAAVVWTLCAGAPQCRIETWHIGHVYAAMISGAIATLAANALDMASRKRRPAAARPRAA
ncbi:MAG: hypothetical protein IJS46_03875, partial [Kiritimatiellae bacterium]|nr:hypothetical protein [Kiritimatiellia bacterium]